MKINIKLPEIEGYEYTGSFRAMVKGEYGSNGNGNWFIQDDRDDLHLYFILKKVHKWRKVNCLSDLGKEARFRVFDQDSTHSTRWWDEGRILMSISLESFICSNNEEWDECEVKDDE